MHPNRDCGLPLVVKVAGISEDFDPRLPSPCLRKTFVLLSQCQFVSLDLDVCLASRLSLSFSLMQYNST